MNIQYKYSHFSLHLNKVHRINLTVSSFKNPILFLVRKVTTQESDNKYDCCAVAVVKKTTDPVTLCSTSKVVGHVQL